MSDLVALEIELGHRQKGLNRHVTSRVETNWIRVTRIRFRGATYVFPQVASVSHEQGEFLTVLRHLLLLYLMHLCV